MTLFTASTRSRARGFGNALSGVLPRPVGDLEKPLALDAVVLTKGSKPRFDRGAVDFVHDLVADIADEFAEIVAGSRSRTPL